MPGRLTKPDMRNIRGFLWGFLFILMLALSLKSSKMEITTLIEGLSHSVSLIRDMFPPNFSGWKKIFWLSAETFATGVWGTLIGMAISFPLCFLASRNTAGSVGVYFISKNVVNLLRAIPEIIYALLFVTTLGMGPLAGTIALAVSSVGLLSKFYSEAVESIDGKAVEAIKATGGHWLSVIRYAVLPQVLPLFMGYNLYMLDHNIRVAMEIGLVGTGGLGLELFNQMRVFHYQKASAILIIIFLIIIMIDRVSVYLRNSLIRGTFPNKGNRTRQVLIQLTVFLLVMFSLYFIPISFKELFHTLPLIWEFIGNMFPPDFSELSNYLRLMLETVGMGISGTFLAIVLAVPLGMFSARNITRSPYIYNLMKAFTDFVRAMPELVFALIFLVAVGLGPFAGVLAIALHSAGLLGKFYAEAIENMDPKPVEAIDATGARLIHRLRYAIFPQILPLFNSYNLYLLDRNIRAATVMGVVGAGGIGFDLVMSMRLIEYKKTAGMVLVILFTIVFIDQLSSYLRKRIV